MLLRSVNPWNGNLIEEFEEYSGPQLAALAGKSGRAFENWRKSSFSLRSTIMKKVADRLLENTEIYAKAITSEMGKPITESRAEVRKCAWVCNYYAENAEKFLRKQTVGTDADLSFITYEPLGAVLGIMPWNFPFWQVFRFAVPTLMAGNTVLLKHASNVQICARHIENIFAEADFPEGVFCNLVVGSGRMKKIIGYDIIKAVSLTGSESAGRQVAEIAGRNLKKTLLELGGSNAFIILDDADLDKAAEIGFRARMQNAGQSCIAAKRFIVHKMVAGKFMELFHAKINDLKPGDPMLEETMLGPLASAGQAESVARQVQVSVEKGARLIVGGDHNGAIYPPVLMTEVKPGMPVFDEEVFGPVAPVIIVQNTEEAISLANKSRFGLGVSLFTSDIRRARRLIAEFKDGAVFVNEMVKSDPRLPFGGTKYSGYGRELSVTGIREFVNIKTVYMMGHL
jgi:succinate-semialdehyde dehydrogenase / glutarate-semialdehyde dehydrogenase